MVIRGLAGGRKSEVGESRVIFYCGVSFDKCIIVDKCQNPYNFIAQRTDLNIFK